MTYETGVKYLLLGHPAWPGNLDAPTYQEAADWFNKHRVAHPTVYVDKVRVQRERLLSPGFAAPPHEFGHDVNDPAIREATEAKWAEVEARTGQARMDAYPEEEK